MSGIVGAMWFDAQGTVMPDVLDRMTDSLAHRGPNERGVFHSQLQHDAGGLIPGVALGARQLSIIDLEDDRQPKSNEDGTIWMVVDGEIYNYQELHRRLDGTGHHYRVQSDTESIIHLYEDLGTDCFEHLNGVFAIALWDSRQRQLILARDRLGKKPLYYQFHNQQLLFGSELKALAQAPTFRKDISPGAVDQYLTYQYIPHPNSIFLHTKKVAPGHFVVFRQREVTQHWTQKYWCFDWSVDSEMTATKAAESVQELLTDSIRLRLRSDVPVGAFLSGGVNSSLIVALSQKQVAEPLSTLNIELPKPYYDDTLYARQVAQWVSSQHSEHQVLPIASEILEPLLTFYDEPLGDYSALPFWCLCQWAKEHIGVALTGDGSCEMFAGYDRYRDIWLSTWLQRLWPLKSLLGSSGVQRLPVSNRQRSFLRRIQRLGGAMSQSLPRRAMHWLQIFPENLRVELYQNDFIAQLPDEDPFQFFESTWKQFGGRDVRSRASLTDLLTYLPCEKLNRIDTIGMAHSLECRQPFLDYRLVELAVRMPGRLKTGGVAGKQILRLAFDRILPRQIWNRTNNEGSFPIGFWFQEPLKPFLSQLLLSPESRCHQFFQPERLSQLLDQNQTGYANHSNRLWSLVAFESWLRRWQ